MANKLLLERNYSMDMNETNTVLGEMGSLLLKFELNQPLANMNDDNPLQGHISSLLPMFENEI